MDHQRLEELLNEYKGYDPDLKLYDVRGTATLGEFLFLLRYLIRAIPHLEWLSNEAAEYADGASDATPAAKFLTHVEESARTLLAATCHSPAIKESNLNGARHLLNDKPFSEVQVSYDLAREDGELTIATITRVFENGCKVLARFEGGDAEAFIDAWNKR